MQIFVATRNPGKRREYQALLSDLGVEILTPEGINLQLEVEEVGKTFEENALLKAHAYVAAAGIPTLADDSGLEVDALGGLPGILSSRWAGPTDADRIRKLLTHLKDVPWSRRSGRFVCVAALALPNGEVVTARGTVEGRILFAPRGTGGFGYDPIFYVTEAGCSMAELSPAEKNRLSHRGRALRALRPRIKALLDEWGDTPRLST